MKEMRKAAPQVKFITSFLDNPKGGLGRYENELIKGFERRRNEVAETDPYVTLGTLHTPRVPLEQTAKRLGLDIPKMAAAHLAALPDAPPGTLYHLSHQLMGRAILRCRALDRRKRQHTPIVVTVHDLFPEVALRDPAFADLKPDWSKHQRWLYHRHLAGLKQADALIAISEATASDIRAYLGVPDERVYTVYHGVEVRQVNPRSHAQTLRNAWNFGDDKLVLYVGSQDARKNLTTLIAAVQTLRVRGVKARLLIVGGARVARGLTDELTHEPGVRLLGHVSDEDLSTLYALADVFAFPSRYEGFGFPPLEAMAHGCPVIASDTTSIPEVVGDAALLAASTDRSAWVVGLERLLSDTALRRTLIARGYARAQAFPWKRTANETAAVYKTLYQIHNRYALQGASERSDHARLRLFI